jgi:hypothetical protein
MGKLMNTRSAQPIRELRPRVHASRESVGDSVYLRQQIRGRIGGNRAPLDPR